MRPEGLPAECAALATDEPVILPLKQLILIYITIIINVFMANHRQQPPQTSGRSPREKQRISLMRPVMQPDDEWKLSEEDIGAVNKNSIACISILGYQSARRTIPWPGSLLQDFSFASKSSNLHLHLHYAILPAFESFYILHYVHHYHEHDGHAQMMFPLNRKRVHLHSYQIRQLFSIQSIPPICGMARGRDADIVSAFCTLVPNTFV